MRNFNPIDHLLSRTTQGLLAATLLGPDRWWYLSDLAKHLGRRPSSLQEPLASLVAAGILRRRKDGNRVYYQADPECPFLVELRGLMAKTAGLVDVLREVLLPLQEKIAVAFVHGSVARGAEASASDVDLIVVGRLGLKQLAPALEAAESRLARPVNASTYTAREFAEKLAAKNHFLQTVLKREKLFIIGNEHDLERIGSPESH